MSDKRVKMSSEEIHQLRVFLLIRAAEAPPEGISHELLFLSAKLDGFHLARENVDIEVQYLVDKKFLAPVDPELSAGIRKCRIFAHGRDYLAQHGFLDA